MADNENKNNMLSFEKLREELGISEDEITDIKKENAEVFDSLQNVNFELSDNPAETVLDDVSSYSDAKHITENGITFVDITEMYVTTPQSNNDEDKSLVDLITETEDLPGTVEEENNVAESDISVKRVRTFNEIFYDIFGHILPLRVDSAKEKVRKIVMDVSIIAIICCSVAFVKFFDEYKEYSQADDVNSVNLQNSAMNTDRSSAEWQKVLSDYPNVSFPEKMDVSFAPFFAENKDFIGWLMLSSSDQFTQVVQGMDNDYYKKHDFYNKKSVFGCPYADYRNSIEELDENTVIYGNADANNSFFSSLKKYKSLDGYKESPSISLKTLYRTYNFKVFAVLIASENSVENNGFSYDVVDFSSDTKFLSYIENIKARSLINTDVSVQTDDKLITLVSDSDEFDGAKLIIVGRLVRDNEKVFVDVEKASLNENAMYPES